MTSAASSYEFHTVAKRTRLLVSALCAAACLGTAWHSLSGAARLIPVAFALAAVAVQVEQQVCIDSTARTVSRSITLWGRPLWSSRRPLDNFSAVAAYRLPCGPPQAPSELVHVGLRRSTGSILGIRYFGTPRSQPCPEAEAFARLLVLETQLPLQGVV